MKKIIGIAALLLLIVGGLIVYPKYRAFFEANVPQDLSDPFVHFPSGSNFDGVMDSLYQNDFLLDTASFRTAAARMNFIKPNMRSGRFEIQPGWSNVDLIRHLRAGEQATVKVILTNARLPEEVAGKVATFIEPDSLELLQAFQDRKILDELGYSEETLMALFIPNTYDFYWNTSAPDFLERMAREHKKFWEQDNRAQKAEKLDLTPQEVYTLASIVEKETNQNSEKRRMAGVYLNRLDRGMRLQADPTCVFATRDFEAKRVLHYHLQFDSPYNTYLYAGLPPGPIAMASIASIDAVLNAEEHDYLFFVARGDGTGLHTFAETLRGHNQNIQTYKANLRQRGLQ